MTPETYIQSQLERLNKPVNVPNKLDKDNLVGFIYQKLMSKKFRKFAVPETNQTTIHSEIVDRVSKQEPIVIRYPFGGYKLWRFEEAPYPDWAELFALIYIVRWLRPVLAVHKPGVRFVFRFDEVVVEKLNNISTSDTEAYQKNFEKILAFVKRSAPKNLEFKVFLERDRYESYEQFEVELAAEVNLLRAKREKTGYSLSEEAKAMIELNVRLKSGQADDPNWQEENDLIHMAFYTLQGKKKHAVKHYSDEGLVAFPFFFECPNLIPIGTTKSSVAKFWVGVGALKKKDESFREIVLSPAQLQNTESIWETTSLPGLDLPNFDRIRIIT